MKKQIVRISILQSSKILTVIYALFGCIYSLIGLPLIIFGSGQIQMVGFIYLFGPLWMGLLGFIFFVIFAAIYNFMASILGGFEFEVRDIA